jgi:predicted phosphodiesterase
VSKAQIKHIYLQLDELYDLSEKVPCNEDSKFVVFSDLHMGDGSNKDDFKQNAELFKTTIAEYYYPKGFSMILNGDVEELQRYSLSKIENAWEPVYDILAMFDRSNRLYKLIGNHDITLQLPDRHPPRLKIRDSLTLQSKYGDLHLFHGHQASNTYRKFNKLMGYTLRYIANPLRIKNFSVAHDSRKQYAIERKVYHHASFRKRVAIIGHTHRPLFESLSKAERLKYRIEQLCRKYAKAPEKKQKPIKKVIKSHKKELKKIFPNKAAVNQHSHIYHSIFHIPCLFNSGCVIGKRGMTCLEIEHGQVALVHWFDKKITNKYLARRGYEPEQFQETDYYRMVLNREYLNYIFTRISLLS